MSVQHSINAQTRTVIGKKVSLLRKQGLIPATVYGKGFTPVSVQLEDRAFNLMYRKAGRTSLIDLLLDGARTSVFVQAVQRHPLSRNIIHIDFKVVDLKVAIHVEVPIAAIGESPLVARGDALLNHALSFVLVEALPAELPQHIDVDVSGLDAMDKSIHVRDIKVAGSYKILTDPEAVVLSLAQVRAVEEEAVVETPAEPELIRRPRESDTE